MACSNNSKNLHSPLLIGFFAIAQIASAAIPARAAGFNKNRKDERRAGEPYRHTARERRGAGNGRRQLHRWLSRQRRAV